MASFLTFKNLQDEIFRGIKDYKKTLLPYVKMTINMVYLNEVMAADRLRPLHWMINLDDSLHAQAPATITGITKSSSGVITTDAAHNFNAGDLVTLHSIIGMTELNDRIFQVATVPTLTTYSIGINTATYTTYTSGGTTHHRGVTLQTNNKVVERVIEVGWHDELPMSPILPSEIEANPNSYHYTDTTEKPKRYMHGQTFNGLGEQFDQIIWHSGADAQYRLRYWFEIRPPLLVNNADVPLLPTKFHHTIIAGVLTRLKENKVKIEKPSVWPGIYVEQLEALRQYNANFWEKAEQAEFSKPYML